jgi:hypothetical protein
LKAGNRWRNLSQPIFAEAVVLRSSSPFWYRRTCRGNLSLAYHLTFGAIDVVASFADKRLGDLDMSIVELLFRPWHEMENTSKEVPARSVTTCELRRRYRNCFLTKGISKLQRLFN